MSKRKNSLWVGPTARLVERIYGSSSPASVFLMKARELVESARQTKPPIDPLALAAALNVRVEERGMALDGFLEKDSSGHFVVAANKEANVQRKRFTVCHE